MGRLKQIAEEAGCSVSTVSRVLNNYKKDFSVNADLELKIRKVSEKLNYKPNPYWRTLRSKKSNLITILCRPISDFADHEKAKWAFIKTIRDAGYSEVVQYMDIENGDVHLPDLPSAGALLFDPGGESEGRELVEKLEETGMPYVVLNSSAGPTGTSVLVDDQQQMYLLLDHLWSLGHRKIAYMNSWADDHYSVSERLKHYLAWTEAHDLEPIPGYDRMKTGAAQFLERTRQTDATAVVCYSAYRAMYLSRAAWNAGVSIPSDLSIVAINDNWAMPLLCPAVTCSVIPWEELGNAAGETILSILSDEGDFAGQQIRLPGHLEVRESTAAPGGTQ